MLVLVVDDERTLCNLMAELLEEQATVIKAYNGKQAFELVREYTPDVIVSDVMMPEMTGIELLHFVKADPKYKHVPVVLLSAALPSPAMMQADVFIRKPFELTELEDVVKKLLEASQATPRPSLEVLPPYVGETEADGGTLSA